MTLRLYNTLINDKEVFVPLKANYVGMYVCGPTVYDNSHMGHARASVVFDVIFRYLKFSGFYVTYVRNITDIDDKIIKRANDEQVAFSVITKRYIKAFHDDMLDLGNKPPTFEPKATDHINDIIALITKLITKDIAYQIDSDVYYSIDNFKDYGKLSGRNVDELIAGKRVELDKRKRNPLDFALWKSSKPDEPSWESPWGMGRPGWHIECSAMSCHQLGESFDIHGGGKDLIFPHHENEVAQSEGASGKPFAKYWLHNGFVNINQEKMSKSLGNFFTIRELLNIYHREVIRLFLLTTHYRSPIDYTDQNLVDAEKSLERVYSTLKVMDEVIYSVTDRCNSDDEGQGDVDKEFKEALASFPVNFRKAMDDDFNTALAIATIFDLVRAINRWLSSPGFTETIAASNILKDAKKYLLDNGSVIGLLEATPVTFLSDLQQKRQKKYHIDTRKIEDLISKRDEARLAKDWGKADEIRDQLSSMGITIKDAAEGTSWQLSQ